MKRIGAHVSAAGGVQKAPNNARDIGARAFALFTKNQRRWKAAPLKKSQIEQFKQSMETGGFAPNHVLPHDSYLINLGNPDDEARTKSYHAFVDELQRCHQLGLVYLNFHPGAHLKKITESESMTLIADCLNRALDTVPDVTAVLENTAGMGSSLGYRFEHLAEIIHQVEDKSRIGVCLDTCHTFAAGYDISTSSGYTATMEAFESIVGIGYLKAMHINDSKTPLASRVDRHHSLGQGEMGLEVFRCIMNDERLDEMPLILETIDSELWPQEIELLYSLIKEEPGQ